MREGKKLLTRAALQQTEKKNKPGCVIAALEFFSVAVFAAETDALGQRIRVSVHAGRQRRGQLYLADLPRR